MAKTRARCMGTERPASNPTRSLPGMLTLLLPSAQTRFELLEPKRLSFENNRLLERGAVTFGDVDTDGDLDILIKSSIFLNDGLGNFTETETRSFSERFTHLLKIGGGVPDIADFDGDGDLDVEVWMGLVNFPIGNKNSGPFIHRLYTNLYTQLELTVRVGDEPDSIQTEERSEPTSTKRLLAFDMYSQNPGRAFLLSDLSGSAAMQIPGLGRHAPPQPLHHATRGQAAGSPRSTEPIRLAAGPRARGHRALLPGAVRRCDRQLSLQQPRSRRAVVRGHNRSRF